MALGEDARCFLAAFLECVTVQANPSAQYRLNVAQGFLLEARQNLAALYAVSLLHQDRRDPLAVVEGEIDLAQVNIPIQQQPVLAFGSVSPDPAEFKPGRDGNQNQKPGD